MDARKKAAITKAITPAGKKDYFPAVREAREILKAKAAEILEKYLAICQEARDKGDFETAAKSLQWLIEHMPNEEGERLIDPSAAKPKEVEGTNQPTIQIGIALGGVGPTKAISPAVIDIKPLDD